MFHVLHAGAAYYRPLLTLSFMFDAQLSGTSPFFYHFSDIIYHLIVSCLVFVFLSRLKIRKELSSLFSAIFAVHPVLSQAIVWLPGRNDTLLALFALPSFILYLKYLETPKPKYILWHLVFLGAALFTKENGLVLPFLIVLYLLLFVKNGIKSLNLNCTIAWIVIAGVWFFLRAIALTNPIHYEPSQVIESLIRDLPAITLHLGKALFPINLSVLPILKDSNLWYGYIALSVLIILLLLSKKRNNKMIIFGVIWFLVFLIPSFVRPDPNYVADFLEHRIYLPIIGLFIVLSEIDFVKTIDLTNKKIIFLLCLLVFTLIGINFTHTYKFKDKLTFWQNAVIDTPDHPLSHKNLGAMYYLDKNLDLAEIEYKKSLELNPQEPMSHNNLGLIYMDRKDYPKAEEEYKKELEINPAYDNAYYNYGLLLFAEGKEDDAIKLWIKTLEINPDYVDAMKNLFVYYYNKKDKDHAQYYYNELAKRGVNLNY